MTFVICAVVGTALLQYVVWCIGNINAPHCNKPKPKPKKGEK